MSKKLVTASGKWDVDIELGSDIVDANRIQPNEETIIVFDDGEVEHIYVTITDTNSGETYEGKLYQNAKENRNDESE